MYKRSVSKMTAMVVSMVLLLMSVGYIQANAIIAPRWTTIAATYNCLVLNSGGRLTCDADTVVQNGYKAGIKVELQQENNGWTTIKTWSSTKLDYAYVYEDWYVVKGHRYRMKLTHTGLTSNDVLRETHETYSNIISYY